MEAKFKFYELVKMISKSPRLKKVWEKTGIVLGRSQDEKGNWYYAVSFEGITWSLSETDIESTGKMSSEKEIYSGKSVSVIITSDSEGKIK